MYALIDQAPEPIIANSEEALIAREAANKLESVAHRGAPIKIAYDDADGAKVIVPLPAKAVALFQQVLACMAMGTPVSVIPHQAELTTQQAADYLNVSRPYLIQKLDSGEVPHRKVGRHRRVLFGDILAYEEACKQKSFEAIREINQEAKRLNID